MIIAASQYTLHLTHDHSSQPYTLHLTHDHIAASQYTLHLTHDHIAASQYTQHLTHDHIAPTFDISVTLLLDSNVSDEVRLSAGVVGQELPNTTKHTANDPKNGREFRWTQVPMSVEAYHAWGEGERGGGGGGHGFIFLSAPSKQLQQG